MPANCLSTYQQLRGRQALKGATVHLHGAQAPAAARGRLISAARHRGDKVFQTNLSQHQMQQEQREISKHRQERKYSQLGCENRWDGDVEESWPRHPELQSSWFLQQPGRTPVLETPGKRMRGKISWSKATWGLLKQTGMGVKT